MSLRSCMVSITPFFVQEMKVGQTLIIVHLISTQWSLFTIHPAAVSIAVHESQWRCPPKQCPDYTMYVGKCRRLHYTRTV